MVYHHNEKKGEPCPASGCIEAAPATLPYPHDWTGVRKLLLPLRHDWTGVG